MRHQVPSEHGPRTIGRSVAIAAVGLVLLAIGSAWQTASGPREHRVTRVDVPEQSVTGLAASSAAESPEPTTSLPPATTSTTAPPEPTTTAAPPPAPAPEREPTSEPVPEVSSEPVPPQPENRLRRVFERAVPASWRDDIPVELVATDGSTSWARLDGTILVSESHRNGGDVFLANVLAHEFGHLVAFRYGTQEYPGAGPEGWPAPSHRPEEVWAKCVAKVFTGDDDHSFGLPPCGGEQLSFAASWLAAGPAGHERA